MAVTIVRMLVIAGVGIKGVNAEAPDGAPPLFRLGSGAELSSVPTHEPNYLLFDKNASKNRFLAKNNFDINFDSLGNNNSNDNAIDGDRSIDIMANNLSFHNVAFNSS